MTPMLELMHDRSVWIPRRTQHPDHIMMKAAKLMRTTDKTMVEVAKLCNVNDSTVNRWGMGEVNHFNQLVNWGSADIKNQDRKKFERKICQGFCHDKATMLKALELVNSGDYSGREVARMVGVACATIQDWMAGKSKVFNRVTGWE